MKNYNGLEKDLDKYLRFMVLGLVWFSVRNPHMTYS